MKIFVSHVNVHQKVTSTGEDFDNQVNKLIRSVATSQPLSPATLVSGQWAHEQSSHSSKDEGFAWAQQHGLPLTKADRATVNTEWPICRQQRPTLSPPKGTIPQGDQPIN